VNIHNPQPGIVKIRKKLASPIEISQYYEDSLQPDAVEGVTCGQLHDFDIHLIHGFEGFLVIESTLSLDVVAVYTAGGNNNAAVASIDVEQIRERKI
jgi:hypothetical protein